MPDRKYAAMPDYRYFNLVGDHHRCGFVMGLATELRVIASRGGQPIDLAFARACADVTREHHAALVDEYRGYAEAQGRPWEDLLPHFSLNHPNGRVDDVVGGCSTLVWRASNGHVMAVRNYDFGMDQRSRHLIRSAPPGVEPVLGTNASLVGGRYDGVNGAGLFVSLHLVRTDAPRWVGPGLPFHQVPRILLETCVSAAEALERILDMPLIHSFNYVLADRRDFYVVEAYPGIKRVHTSDAMIAATNHFRHPDMIPHLGRRNALNSRRRLERLHVLWQKRQDDGWGWAQAVARDHEGPLCNHDRHLATLWSLVVDLTARRIAYCMGSPCSQPFVEREWPGLARPVERR